MLAMSHCFIALLSLSAPAYALRSRAVQTTSPPSTIPPTSYFGYVYECEDPLGPIRENWFDYDTTNATVPSCYNYDSDPCCGPLQNFTSCLGYGTKLPDVWEDNKCSGYSVYDCCYEENGSVKWQYTECSDTQKQNEDAWVNGTCTDYYQAYCCLTKFTSCSNYFKPTPNVWSNGVCYGAYEIDCCDIDVTYTGGSGYTIGGSDDDDYTWTSGVVFWLVLALIVASIVLCSCACCSCCPLYQRCRRTRERTRQVFTTVSNVASTVENVTKSVSNVTDVVSTLQGGNEEEEGDTTIVVVASSDTESTVDVGTVAPAP